MKVKPDGPCAKILPQGLSTRAFTQALPSRQAHAARCSQPSPGAARRGLPLALVDSKSDCGGDEGASDSLSQPIASHPAPALLCAAIRSSPVSPVPCRAWPVGLSVLPTTACCAVYCVLYVLYMD